MYVLKNDFSHFHSRGVHYVHDLTLRCSYIIFFVKIKKICQIYFHFREVTLTWPFTYVAIKLLMIFFVKTKKYVNIIFTLEGSYTMYYIFSKNKNKIDKIFTLERSLWPWSNSDVHITFCSKTKNMSKLFSIHRGHSS